MHKQIDSRFQMMQSCLDDIIAESNPIRTLDAIIDNIFQQPGVEIPTGKCRLGRRAFSAKDLTKLLIYGYINGITSCRKLEEATRINREMAWLIRNQCPGYKTIANFRKDNLSFISTIFYQMIQMLHAEGMISGTTWVIDGNKTKANAKRDMESISSLKKQISSLERSIEESLQDMEIQGSKPKGKDDDPDDSPSSGTGRSKSKEDIQTEIDDKILTMNQKQDLLDRAEELGKSYISSTDEDALLLSTRRGKCAAFNVQYVADADHHMIVGALPVNEPNDRKSLYTTIRHASKTTKIRPKQVVADRGYTNYGDIKRLQEEITDEVYVIPQRSTKDEFNKLFRRDAETGVGCCPKGRAMKKISGRYDKGTYYDTFTISGCKTCEHNAVCAGGKDKKLLKLSENHEFIEQYCRKMKEPKNKEITAKRKGVIEHIFGTIAQMMHFNGFKLRGIDKIQIEAYLYAISYNFKRLFTLIKTKIDGSSLKNLFPDLISHLFILVYSTLTCLFCCATGHFCNINGHYYRNNRFNPYYGLCRD